MKESRPAPRLPGLKTLAAAAVLACSAAAHAGGGSATVTSFAYTVSGGSLSWLDPYQSFQAIVLNGGGLLGSNSDSADAPDFNLLSAGASITGAVAGASTISQQTFSTSAFTSATTGPAFTPRNQANSFAQQSAGFTLSQAGTVTFTVGYSLNAASAGGNASDNFAIASLHFNAANSDNTSPANPDRSLTVRSFDSASQSVSQTGTWTLSVALKAGEQGYYTLDGSAVSFSPITAVPEPGAWMLMASGLFAVGFVARRRQRAGTAS